MDEKMRKEMAKKKKVERTKKTSETYGKVRCGKRAMFSPDRVPIDIKRESLDHGQEVEIDVEKEEEEEYEEVEKRSAGCKSCKCAVVLRW